MMRCWRSMATALGHGGGRMASPYSTAGTRPTDAATKSLAWFGTTIRFQPEEWSMTIPIDKSPAIKFQRHPLDELCINTIRTLAIDAIQAANSGHPGTPMAMAPVGYYLWQYVLRFDQDRKSTRLKSSHLGI